jgi:hypothetical protein
MLWLGSRNISKAWTLAMPFDFVNFDVKLSERHRSTAVSASRSGRHLPPQKARTVPPGTT